MLRRRVARRRVARGERVRDRADVRYIKKTLDTQMPWENLRAMVEAVREAGMVTMVTPFDEVSVDKCVEFGVDILKIASSDIRDKTLLAKIRLAIAKAMCNRMALIR